jgi:hypothetical protein
MITKKDLQGIKCIPKADSGFRKVSRLTDKDGTFRLYAWTGKTRAGKLIDKYTTLEMVNWMNEQIQKRKGVDFKSLNGEFPQSCSQGSCVFTITGGILVCLGYAKYKKPCYSLVLP